MGFLYEKKGRIAYMTIDRPKALNSLDMQTYQEMSQALLDFRSDNDVWVAIITGSGERAFCAGADIGEMLPNLQRIRNEWWRMPPTLFRELELWKPTIAAINGHCHGRWAGGSPGLRPADRGRECHLQLPGGHPGHHPGMGRHTEAATISRHRESR